MSSGAPHSPMTAGEYLAWEREQRDKHEFHHGEIFAMAGGSPRHNALCAAVIRDIGVAVRGGECRMLTSDQRVSLEEGRRYVYPDATLICGRLELEPSTSDVVTNPTAVIEVLSKSTERYDRGGKWVRYRALASLDDYLLVSQRTVSVEHFQRQDDGSWRYTAAGAGERVTLSSGAAFAVDDIYDGVFDLPGDEDDDEAPGP